MSRTLLGFLVTAGLWLLLVAAYSGIELARGNVPFALLRWDVGGKFIFIVVVVVLALGTLVGYASDRIQERQGRR